MKLPKKIDVQNLVETIVELRFIPNPELNRDLWAGLLATKLNDLGFQYINVPVLNLVPENDGVLKFTIDTKSINPSVSFFANDEKGLRIVIDNSNVSFNCLRGKYIGWDTYYENIVQVLEIVISARIALSFERTMIRYINEYDYNILDNVKIRVEQPASDEYGIREISLSNKKDNFFTYISLSGLRERTSKTTAEKKISSLFDVNVFEKLNQETTLHDICRSLNDIHKIEKETFFNLLKEDYLKSLNPEY